MDPMDKGVFGICINLCVG